MKVLRGHRFMQGPRVISYVMSHNLCDMLYKILGSLDHRVTKKSLDRDIFRGQPIIQH